MIRCLFKAVFNMTWSCLVKVATWWIVLLVSLSNHQEKVHSKKDTPTMFGGERLAGRGRAYDPAPHIPTVMCLILWQRNRNLLPATLGRGQKRIPTPTPHIPPPPPPPPPRRTGKIHSTGHGTTGPRPSGSTTLRCSQRRRRRGAPEAQDSARNGIQSCATIE